MRSNSHNSKDTQTRWQILCRAAIFLIVLAAHIFLGARTSSAAAANIYITQNGNPSGNCTSNVQTPAFFNNANNWGSGTSQIGPGTTVLLCGTFTGTAGTGLLTVQGNGTSGNPITILFDTNTNMTAPYWNPGPINIIGKSWIVVNGGSNGTIQNTANGTGLTYQQASYGVNVNGSSNVIIENITIANMCQHTSSSDTNGCQSGGNGDAGIGIGGGTNVTITKNTIHDTQIGILYAPQSGDSNVTISNNTIYRTNWAIGGGLNSGSMTGLTITGNDISCVVGGTCNWDDVGDDFHHNGIMLYPQGGTQNGVVISNNWIHDINGNTTAGIFLDPQPPADLPGIQIYNNVLTTTPGQSGPANAQITVGIGVSNAKVLNNTIAGPATQAMSGQVNPTFENNIATGMSYGEVLNGGYAGVVSTNNDFFNIGLVAGNSVFSTLASWISSTGLDAGTSSLSANPNLTASFTLGPGSPAIGAGTNLSALGIRGLAMGAPQTFGANGNCGNGCVARSASGSWDMGAYPNGTNNQPAAPTNLSAIIQ